MTQDDDSGWMEAYGKDYDYFHANRDGLYKKHKNEFVAIKSLKVYHDASPLKLLEQLMANVVMTLITRLQDSEMIFTLVLHMTWPGTYFGIFLII